MSSSLAPGFLIAAPQLLDPNFKHSVVLLLQADDEGAMGVVINRDSPILLRDLCRDHDIPYAGSPDKTIRVGGPVSPEQGLVLFGPEHDGCEGQSVLDGLQVSASTDTLQTLCGSSGGRYQCYAGYAGWGPGQLERELREGSWIVGAVSPGLVLDVDPDGVWAQALEELGIDPALLVPGGTEEA